MPSGTSISSKELISFMTSLVEVNQAIKAWHMMACNLSNITLQAHHLIVSTIPACLSSIVSSVPQFSSATHPPIQSYAQLSGSPVPHREESTARSLLDQAQSPSIVRSVAAVHQ